MYYCVCNAQPNHAHVHSVYVRIRLCVTGTSQENLLQHLRQAARDAGVDAEVVAAARSHRFEPSSVTPAKGTYFRLLKRAIQETWQHNGKVCGCLMRE